jgi:predicted hydrocarbon binding protein
MQRMIKGGVALGYLQFIKRKWGSDGADDCMRSLNFGKLDLVEDRPYPKELVDGIYKWMTANHGNEAILAANRFAVKNIGFMAYIVKFVSIERVLGSVEAGIADALNFGKVEVSIGKNSAIIKMFDINQSELDCLGWRGAFEGMLAMTRTKGSVEEVACMRRGSKHCEFEVKWK